MRRILTLLLASLSVLPILSRGDTFSFYTDPLAQRDEFGLLHQSPVVGQTDLAPRYPCRFEYYFVSGNALTYDSAYVGALQIALSRRGYFSGPIDGVYSQEVAGAIARMQKNYSQRVTGTLTIGIRRALHLP